MTLKSIELWQENYTSSLQLMLSTQVIEEVNKAKLSQDKWIYSILKDKKSMVSISLSSNIKLLRAKMENKDTLLQREPTIEAKLKRSHKFSWMVVVKLSSRTHLLEQRTMRSRKNLLKLWESSKLEEMAVWAFQMLSCLMLTQCSMASICQVPRESIDHQPRGWSSIKTPLGATRLEFRLELGKEITLKLIVFPQARVT